MEIKNIKEVTHGIENLRKKESNRNTKHNGRSLQQIRKRQNLRIQR
jgi:hypothetical protein